MDKVQRLEIIKNTVEQMNKDQQLEILKILNKHPDVKLNENKSGVFVNLSFLPDVVLNDMDKYLNYVKDQEKSLDTMETQKQCYKETFFA